MVKCNKCGEEIEWKKSEKTGKNYPINPNTNPGDDNYFHSKTCKPKSIAQRERVDNYTTGDKVDSTIRDIVDAIKELTNEVKRINENLEKEHRQADGQDA